jgi:hypothetical protein
MFRMFRTFLAVALCAGAAGCAKKVPSPDAAESRVDPGHSPEKGAGEILTELDLNHDGKTDVWKYTRKTAQGKEILVRKERDLNNDGKIDVWEWYDADGNLEKQAIDFDFDGKPDVVLYFEKGQLVRKEMAFGFDGKPHAWSYYEKGHLVRKERDENGDGKVDYWEYWEGGEIDRIGIDTDGDGRVDRWESRRAASAAAEGEKPGGEKPAAR